MDVRLGLITESNQMIGVWLGLIEFCFDFVSIRYAGFIKWRLYKCINLVNCFASRIILNPLSPNVHIQILQTDLYIFP